MRTVLRAPPDGSGSSRTRGREGKGGGGSGTSRRHHHHYYSSSGGGGGGGGGRRPESCHVRPADVPVMIGQPPAVRSSPYTARRFSPRCC